MLMSFVNDKKKVESVMIKQNTEAFNDKSNTNMLIGPKLGETMAKILIVEDKI